MILGSNFGEQGVSSNLVNKVFADVGNLHGVLEGSGCVAWQFAQGWGVGRREFEECEVGGQSEHLLKDVNEGIGQQEE